MSDRTVGKDDEKDGKDSEKGGPPGAAKLLFESRQITLFGAVDDKLANKIVAQLLALEASDPAAPITMILNSPGGSVSDGFAIYDTMRFIKPDVRVICFGLAASIATIILLGAPKDQRYATPNTKLLIHQVYIPGVIRGQATDLEITAKDLIATRQHINGLLAQETGQDIARINKDTNRDYWMTAEEALEYGLISSIVTHRGELS